MLLKKSLFVTSNVFREIIVWLRVDLPIYIQSAWQATVSTETGTSKFRFLEQTYSSLFTYAKRATSHGIAEISNKIIVWKATCPKPPLRKKLKLDNQANLTTLHQDLHKTVTSLIHRMNCRAAPFIYENLGTWRANLAHAW